MNSTTVHFALLVCIVQWNKHWKIVQNICLCWRNCRRIPTKSQIQKSQNFYCFALLKMFQPSVYNAEKTVPLVWWSIWCFNVIFLAYPTGWSVLLTDGNDTLSILKLMYNFETHLHNSSVCTSVALLSAVWLKGQNDT